VNVTPRFAAAVGGRKLDDSNSVRNIDLLSEVISVGTGFKIDVALSIVCVLFLQLWPTQAVQIAVNEQMKGGYVAGWAKYT